MATIKLGQNFILPLTASFFLYFSRASDGFCDICEGVRVSTGGVFNEVEEEECGVPREVRSVACKDIISNL